MNSKLKSMITEQKTTYERKGADIEPDGICYLRLILTSNDTTSVVQASADERRFIGIDFGPMANFSGRDKSLAFLNSSGLERVNHLRAVANILLEMDVENFAKERAVHTSILADQIADSASLPTQWLNSITIDSIKAGDFSSIEGRMFDGDRISFTDVQEAFSNWILDTAHMRYSKENLSSTKLASLLKQDPRVCVRRSNGTVYQFNLKPQND
jgi:hypothetical protein